MAPRQRRCYREPRRIRFHEYDPVFPRSHIYKHHSTWTGRWYRSSQQLTSRFGMEVKRVSPCGGFCTIGSSNRANMATHMMNGTYFLALLWHSSCPSGVIRLEQCLLASHLINRQECTDSSSNSKAFASSTLSTYFNSLQYHISFKKKVPYYFTCRTASLIWSSSGQARIPLRHWTLSISGWTMLGSSPYPRRGSVFDCRRLRSLRRSFSRLQ